MDRHDAIAACRRTPGVWPSSARHWARVTASLAVVFLATTGARADEPPGTDLSGGYIDDATCASCHPDLAASYRQVGMSRSFGDAATVEAIEVYSTDQNPEAGRYFHPPSGRWYEMRRSGPQARPVFRRWHVDDDGAPIHEFESEVDWALGSGHTSRSYLLHQPSGELFVLPIAWYTQGGVWRMAPGFDMAEHLGLQRLAQHECMFCHNAYPPEVLGVADRYSDPHVLPGALPHGTGCQRCHGPGEDHVEAAYLGGLDDAVRSTIVHPGRLSSKLRDDVCEQCHLQPSVAFMPVRKFGRRVYDYRPGTDLDDYIVYYDPVEADRDRGDRFEINHHPYRLRQSACFVESRAREEATGQTTYQTTGLSCLTCHDPHRKVPEPQRAEHYRRACQSCHEVDACGLEAMTSAPDVELPLHIRGVEAQDCVTCHMPRRRTRDVVHVVMTDHKIARLPGGEDPDASLVAPREEYTPALVDMDFYLPDAAPKGALGDVYQAYGVEKIGGNDSSFRHLGRSLLRSGIDDPEPWLQLGRSFLRRRQFDDQRRALQTLLAQDPDNPRALTWLGLANAQEQQFGEAIELLETARDASGHDDPNLLYNLGLFYRVTGRAVDALVTLGRVVEIRPLHAPAWFQLGLLYDQVGRHDDAIESLRTCLEVDPTHSRASRELAQLLAAGGQLDEAARILRHDVRWGVDGEASKAELETLSALRSGSESIEGGR